MIRHDYKANYYSTLNQTPRRTLTDLRLVWTWPCRRAAPTGISPRPIVHGGVLYVTTPQRAASPGCENWRADLGESLTAPTLLQAAMRGITIYDDRFSLPTNQRI